MRLVVPERQCAGLQAFVDYTDDEFESILNALAETPPTLYMSKLAEGVAASSGTDEARIRGTLQALAGVYLLLENAAVDELVEDVCRAVGEVDDEKLRFDDSQNERFRTRLRRILALENPVGITAKASSVMMQHPHLYCRSRIISEVRPIFHVDASEPPAAAMVAHTLCIRYHQGKDTKEFYVALDSEDLGNLQASLARAIKKEESLKQAYGRPGVPFLEATE